jgi:hypothetical protein
MMENFSQRFADALIKAEKDCYSAEHILRVIMPVVKDQKLLLRVLENVHKSSIEIISLILKFEYLSKRVDLSSDTKKNQETFFKKCINFYGLNIEESNDIKELLILGKKHKKSGFEFSRRNKIIIMDDDLGTSEVNKEILEQYIRTLRKLILNAKAMFSKSRLL